MYVHFLNLICAQKSHTVRYLCVEQYLFMIIYTIEVCNQGNTNSVLPLTLTVSGLSSGQAGLVPTLSDTTAQRKLWPKPHFNSDYNKTVYFKRWHIWRWVLERPSDQQDSGKWVTNNGCSWISGHILLFFSPSISSSSHFEIKCEATSNKTSTSTRIIRTWGLKYSSVHRPL